MTSATTSVCSSSGTNGSTISDDRFRGAAHPNCTQDVWRLRTS